MPKIYKPQNELGNTLIDITKVGYNSDNSFNADFVSIENEINSEETARIAADTTLQENIDNERTRAQAAETTLQSNIEAETTRATGKETELDGKISAEVSRAQEAEETLQNNIDGEVNRATAAEATLQTNIDNEVTRATEKENELNASITAEVQRAQGAEAVLNTRITDLESTSIKTVSVDDFINENTADNTVTLSLNVSTGNIDSSISAVDGDTDGSKTVSTVKDVNTVIAIESQKAADELATHTTDAVAHMNESDREKFESVYNYCFPKITVYELTSSSFNDAPEIKEEILPDENGNANIILPNAVGVEANIGFSIQTNIMSGTTWMSTGTLSNPTLPEGVKTAFKINIINRNNTTYVQTAEQTLTERGTTIKFIVSLRALPVTFTGLNNIQSTQLGGEQSIVFSCNSPEDGNVVSDADWCTANIEKTGSTSESGGVTFTESNLTLNIAENSTGAERIANVTVTIQGTPKTITVTQAGS